MTGRQRARNGRIQAVAAVALLAGVFVAGCGGDETLTKAEFIKQGDAICKAADKAQLVALEKVYEGNLPPVGKAAELAAIRDSVLPVTRKQINELSDLPVPGGDEAKVHSILTGMEKALKELEDDPMKFESGKLGAPFDPVDEMAAKYGFKECSEGL